MNDTTILQRLRRFLLWLAAGLCVGTIVELWAAEHTEDPIQYLPFLLAGVGLVTILVVLWRPQRGALLAMRGVMVVLALGSLLGVALHIFNNIAFAQEIQPNAATGELLLAGLMGANPMLAPGILALAAILAFAATYAEPALGKNRV